LALVLPLLFGEADRDLLPGDGIFSLATWITYVTIVTNTLGVGRANPR